MRLRVSRYCCPASSNDVIELTHRISYFFLSVLECALECCAHTPHVSRRRVRRLRHNVPEACTYMSRTSDSSMLEARCEVKDPKSSKRYGILPVLEGFWRIIARCREFSLQPAVTRWVFKVHDSKFTMLFVEAFTGRVWLSTPRGVRPIRLMLFRRWYCSRLPCGSQVCTLVSCPTMLML